MKEMRCRALDHALAVVLICSLQTAGSAWSTPPAAGTNRRQDVQRLELARLAPRGFEEPLIATAPTSRKEDEALLHAVRVYLERAHVDDFSAIDGFLAEYPHSGWGIALRTNLGLSYYHYGYFSKALASWDHAWKDGKLLTEPSAKALVDRAIGELIRMHARIGHSDAVEALLEEVENRHVSGPATEAITGAREGLWMMRHEPGVAYLCGPMALKGLLLSQGANGQDGCGSHSGHFATNVLKTDCQSLT